MIEANGGRNEVKKARNRTTGGVKFEGEYAGYASQRDNIIIFLL